MNQEQFNRFTVDQGIMRAYLGCLVDLERMVNATVDDLTDEKLKQAFEKENGQILKNVILHLFYTKLKMHELYTNKFFSFYSGVKELEDRIDKLESLSKPYFTEEDKKTYKQSIQEHEDKIWPPMNNNNQSTTVN